LARRLGARAVLAVGGYASGPMALGAWTAGIPVAVLAPDVVLGLTNRWLLPFARRVYVAFAPTEARIGRRALRSGVPLRGGFRPAPYASDSSRFAVLVLGGSLGAAALNEMVPRALARAAPGIPPLSVLHQTGQGRQEEVTARYRELGLGDRARVVPFIDDVAAELSRADLVIGRAGAGAIAELCAVGRAAILLPLTTVRVHQAENAEALAAAGGAICLAHADATAERLTENVVDLARDGSRRARMAEAARNEGRPEAARTVARDLLALAGGAHV
jgi:UDP-N-acetylglucosamine--N-acetylmuramyl-(pentapeptide) pyrophosphoryl-undecaprenol N-acetylglucosamine transferase